MKPDETLALLEQFATDFAHRHLDAYAATVRLREDAPKRKEVNDALWGTIGLTPAEVVLLDSPLIQRLRYVRQLGVVHWVYPGAGHSRFEHTLGVLFQVQHLMLALNAEAASAGFTNAPLIDSDTMQLLRLCALLHDVGHAAFSHVSELALESLPQFSPLAAAFSTRERVEERHLSEIFAYFVVRSKAMANLLEVLLDRCSLGIRFDTDRARNVAVIAERISGAIIGRKIDDRLPLLHELISGPFDADKLDYFVRDARMAGTPSIVDISRLVQKLTVRFLDMAELPKEISSNVRRLDTKYCLFGMKWSGVAVLDELLLARVLLFAKIYRHPKVSAIEQMLRAVITSLAKEADSKTLLEFIYTHTDDALLNLDPDALGKAIGLSNTSLPDRIGHAASILADIRERRLWVRGFQIHRRYPADPRDAVASHKDALIAFQEDVEHPQNREPFIANLRQEVHRILELLKVSPKPSVTELESLVMVHTLGATPGGTKISRAYLLPSSGAPLPFREYTVNRSAWADSYLSDQPKGFVFSAPQLADYVYIAVEKLLRTTYEIQLPPSALETSKRSATRVSELKRRLEQAGYYHGVPFDIRPIPDRLQNADVPQVIDAFDRLRAAYQEPAMTGGTPWDIVRTERTSIWLRQFVDEESIELAMQLLTRFRMLTRNDTVNAVSSFVASAPEFRGACVVPFGESRDSGAIQTYFSADLIGTAISSCTTLDDATKTRKQAPIIFVDDFVGSGGQASDILAAGFGNSELRQLQLGEERSEFEATVKDHLREVPVAFVFTAAWDAGVSRVEDAAKRLGMKAKVYRSIRETEIPFAFEGSHQLEGPAVERFKVRCAEIGEALLAKTPDSESLQKKRKDRVLGYGNRGMLLASPFNVPTQTLTAIWAHGTVGGVDWYPLLARRAKK